MRSEIMEISILLLHMNRIGMPGRSSMEDFNDINELRLLPVGSPAATPILSRVTHVYTDLDGTLLAPGGRLLTTHSGKPSSMLAQALTALKVAGVEVILVTGRNRIQATEILRLLDLNSFIGEMGTVLQIGFGADAEISYALGHWSEVVLCEGLAPGEIPDDLTPYEVISKSGAIDRLFEAFPNKLEHHRPYGDSREVTQMLRGSVDMATAKALLSQEILPLELLDNGIIHPKVHTLVGVDEIHAYHLVPRGTSKSSAVAADIARRKLEPEQTLAIGDAVSDVLMGEHTGSLVVVQNALKNQSVISAISARRIESDNLTKANDPLMSSRQDQVADCFQSWSELKRPTFSTKNETADGWVEFARALLLAKELG